MTRVLVADDHAPTRAGVRAVLENAGCEVCAEVATAEQAVAAAVTERPDVCLIDVEMPGDGLRAVRRIATDVPATRVLMLTVSRSEADLFDALRAGAVGYLLKDMDPADLPGAVVAAAAGEGVLDGVLTGMLIEEFRRRSTGRPTFDVDHTHRVDMTPREWEVLELLGDGLSTAEIAKRLFLSQVTVRRHISMLMGKLDVTSREQLRGLLSRRSS